MPQLLALARFQQCSIVSQQVTSPLWASNSSPKYKINKMGISIKMKCIHVRHLEQCLVFSNQNVFYLLFLIRAYWDKHFVTAASTVSGVSWLLGTQR